MTFLVDNQLPRALARHFERLGQPAQHVAEVGLREADDPAIWAWAKANAAVIVVVSKDADFAQLSLNDPDGPQIVWLRVGNQSTRDLLAIIDRVYDGMLAALQAGQKIVEVR